MKDKDLRRMSRAELIEIIYQYRMKTDELTAENDKLREQLDERIIKLDKSGSIAEAALSLNSVFEAAQNAANQYLESVKASVQPKKEEAVPAESGDVNADKPAESMPEVNKSPESSPEVNKPADLQPKIRKPIAKTRRKKKRRR